MPSSVTMRTTGVSPMTAHFRSVIFIFPQMGPRWKCHSPEGTHRQVTSRGMDVCPGGSGSRGAPGGGGDGLADGDLMAGAGGFLGGEEDLDDVAAPGGGYFELFGAVDRANQVAKLFGEG